VGWVGPASRYVRVNQALVAIIRRLSGLARTHGCIVSTCPYFEADLIFLRIVEFVEAGVYLQLGTLISLQVYVMVLESGVAMDSSDGMVDVVRANRLLASTVELIAYAVRRSEPPTERAMMYESVVYGNIEIRPWSMIP